MKQNTIKVVKSNDECCCGVKYHILKNNEFYTGNISKYLLNIYINIFRKKGYNII